MAFLGAPPLSGQVLGLWPDCCRDINVILAGHPYYHAWKGKKQYTLPDPCAIDGSSIHPWTAASPTKTKKASLAESPKHRKSPHHQRFSKKKRSWRLYQERISHMVGMIGFEPMVFCSQSRRDNQTSLHPEARTLSAFWARIQVFSFPKGENYSFLPHLMMETSPYFC